MNRLIEKMRWRLLFVLVYLTMGAAVSVADDDAAQLAAELVNPGYQEKPQWFKNSFLDIREDITEATGESRRLLLYFYQDGCPYCAKLISDNFGQVDIAEKTQRHFDTIAINMWGDREVFDLHGEETTEKEFAKSLRVQFTPTLLFLDEAGDTVVRINGYFAPHKFSAVLDFVGQKLESETDARSYLASRDTVPATGKLHRDSAYLQPPYFLKDELHKRKKPLLVMFEQQQCSVCDELHLDILKRPESVKLTKQFDIALVDIRSTDNIQTPSGEWKSTKTWAFEERVQYAPTLVFFDTGGKEVFRTEGYLKSFHIQSALDYVASEAYLSESEFQRYISARADRLDAQGIHVDIMD